MKQRGRPSSVAMSLVTPQSLHAIERPLPPHDLNDEEVEVWQSIVSQEIADWFTAATQPLLAQYCRHVVHARRIAELIDHTIHSAKEMPWIEEYDKLLRIQERETRAMTLLATTMRLTQQSSRHDKSRKTQVLNTPWSRGQQG